MQDDAHLFNAWFVEPLRTLSRLPAGNGGFVALATACFLYERYATAILDKRGSRAGTEELVAQLASDFAVDQSTASTFWKVIRDGILHQGMPLQQARDSRLPKWAFHHNYPAMALGTSDGQPFLKVQPWKFMERVIELWLPSLPLLRASGSFPWATIADVPE